MVAPPADAVPDKVGESQEEEVDLWWGSYAGRAMAPSFAVCILLTLLVLFGSRSVVRERGWVQLTFTGLASLIWIVQVLRWCRRYFTWNYRLTSRFLYRSRGMRRLVAMRYRLESISSITIRRKALAKLLGIGDIVIWFDDSAKEKPVVLQAINDVQAAADVIRDAVKAAKEPKQE